MPSFFTTFKDKFTKAVQEQRTSGIDLGGRYLALILEEALSEDPLLAKAFFPDFDIKIKNGRPQTEFSVETEYPFRAGKNEERKRRADIKIVCGEKTGFLEIKWEDEFTEGQLDDYIEYCSGNGFYFSVFYLRPDKFTQEERDKIRNGLPDGRKRRGIGFVSCKEFYRKLTGRNGSIAALFRNFLEDNIMEYNKSIPRGALLAIMKTGLNWKDSDGLQKIMVAGNLDAVPDTWKILLTNIKVVGSRLYEKISAKDKDFTGNAPNVDFSFEPYFYAAPIKRELENNNAKRIVADKFGNNTTDSSKDLRVHADGGVFYSNSRMVIKPENCKLNIGMYFEFWPENGHAEISFGIHCWFGKDSTYLLNDWNKPIKLGDSSKKHLSIPDEDVLFERILKTTREMFEKAESNSQTPASPKTIKKLLAALS